MRWVWGLLLVVFGVLAITGCQRTPINQVPVASFTIEPADPFAGEDIIFDASSSFDPDGEIISYHWWFGDGEEDEGDIVTHAYWASGTYTVRLTVTDDRGASATAEAQVTVREPPTPLPPLAAFTLDPAEGYAPLEVRMDASPSRGQIVEYRWDFGDGSTGTGKIVTHTYIQPGQYRVQLTVRDSQNLTDSEEKWVTVRAQEAPEPLLARFTANPKEGQVPLTVNFDASSSTGPIVEYRWDFGDGATGSGKQVTHTYTQPGLFTVRLTVRAADGREAQAEDQILAAPVPPPPPG